MAYRGVTAPIPLGSLGVISDLPPGDIPPGALLEAKNVTFEKGLIQKAPGGLRYNGSALSAGVVAMFDWWPDINQQRLIVATRDGSIYRDTGGRNFGTAIKTGLGVLTPQSQFIAAGQESTGSEKKLFFFPGGNKQVQVLAGDASTFSDIDNPAADWTAPNFPKVGIVHRNRLWAFMGQVAYASDTANHENFTSNNLIQYIYPGEGGEIRGAYVFKGRLFAFKDGGFTYFLDDSDSNSSNWVWKKLASNFGLSSPNAIFDALNDMIAGNTTGTLTSYTATETLGDVESGDLFRNGQMEAWARNVLNKAGLSEQHALYYPEKKLGFFTFRSGYRTENDTLLVIDVNRPNPRFSRWVKGTPNCLALRKDSNGIERPIYGDESGYVILMDREDRLEATASYEARFDTPHMDFRQIDPRLMNQQKHFDFLEVEYIPEGDWDLTMGYFVDGQFVEETTIPMRIETDYLDEFLLEDAGTPDVTTPYLHDEHTRTFQVPLRATGKRISFYFTQSGSNQSFQIAGLRVGFRASGNNQEKA